MVNCLKLSTRSTFSRIIENNIRVMTAFTDLDLLFEAIQSQHPETDPLSNRSHAGLHSRPQSPLSFGMCYNKNSGT